MPRHRLSLSVTRILATPRSGFTLVELLVVILIIGTMSSLMLGGLGVARNRARAARTEVTIRKIHEIIMPHYERSLTRGSIDRFQSLNPPAPNTAVVRAAYGLAARRALQAVELPDGWTDVLATARTNPPSDGQHGTPLLEMTNSANFAFTPPTCTRSVIATRFLDFACPQLRSSLTPPERKNAILVSANQLTINPAGSGECLWMSVMRGGFADPGIVESFRADESADPDGNGIPTFIDGWGNPILFLRWAPGFVSRYQPDPANVAAQSHDVFDTVGVDNMARTTLFPLIFSAGSDGEIGIEHRNADGNASGPPWPPAFSFQQVGYDPYFKDRPANQLGHFSAGGSVIGPYQSGARGAYSLPFGAAIGTNAGYAVDNIHNHSMSR